MNVEPFKLAGKTAAGAAWLVSSKLATKVFDFASLLILARLLNPNDFGIVAIAVPVIQIIEAVLEIPVSQVLVSRDNIERSHLDTAFTLSAIRGCFLAIFSLIIALPFSQIYGDTRLASVMPIIGIAPALRGLVSPQLAVFAKHLDYRPNFLIDVSGKIGALILSCVGAFLLQDYRAILIGIVAGPTISTITSYFLAPFFPRLSLREWRSFAHFMSWTTASQALAALNWQIDRLILAQYVSREKLGEFSLANDLSYLPEQSLVKPIIPPLMSAFVALRSDKEQLALAYSSAAVSVLALGLPVMLSLSLLSEPFVNLVLGGKWVASIPQLKLLSLTLIPALFVAPMPALAMALRRPEIPLYQLLIESIFKIPMIIFGAISFGTDGVIIARGVSGVIAAFAALYFVRRLTGSGIARQLLASVRVLGGGAFLAVTIVSLRPILQNTSIIALASLLPVVAGAGLVAYCASIFIIWHFAGRPKGLESLVLDRVKMLIQRRAGSGNLNS